ncbi:MAG: PAS domain S-box protein [Verrucomicrobiota bacterium]
MAPGASSLNQISRVRQWLFDQESFRAKLLGSLIVSLLAVAIFIAVSLLVSLRFYQAGAAGAGKGLEWIELIRIAACMLMGVIAIGTLVASSWYSFNTYQRHLAKVQLAEARSRSIVAASPDAILRLDINGLILSCNDVTEAMFGYEAEALVGQKISKLIPQRHFLHDVATLGRTTFFAYAQRQNFDNFPVEVTATESDTEGRRTFIVLIHDASEQRFSQETAHHISMGVSSMTGEKFVQNLVLHLSQVLQNDYAFVLELDSSPKTGLCSLLVAEAGQIRAKTRHNLAGTAFQEALSSGFTAIERGVLDLFPHDEILRRLEAQSFCGTPLLDKKGRMVGLIGVIGRSRLDNLGVVKQTLQIFTARAASEIERKQEAELLAIQEQRLRGDVNLMRATAERDRKRYEEDIAAEQELLAVTLRSIREGCITTDNDGRIIMVNPVAEELTGWTQPEAGDRRLGEVVRLLGARNRRPFEVDLLIDHPDQLSAQMVLVSREGVERLVEATAAFIRNREDRKLGIVLVFRDVTEKQRAEEERHKAEKLESLGLAAGGIAHDFNNLLTAIIGNLSLALPTTPAGARERIEASKKASLRAQELAQQLLTFAKGGAPIKKTASMRQLVLDTVGFSLSGTNIRSSFALAEDLWPVEIDAGQISQVITNLAVNAVQAMTDGGTLHVEGANLMVNHENGPASLRSGRYVRIVIRDEGPGIPPDIQKNIFDPYFTTKPRGSGLGLATSYSIVKNHDGLITVESNPGEGARFLIYLPASEAELVPEIENPAPRLIRSGSILVLDDEEAICDLVECALTPLGYSVAQATNAAKALELYEAAFRAGHPFDLVVMDLTIPGGMGGKEAIKHLKEIDPAAKAIVSSGYAMDPIMSRFGEYGFCGVIAKPYDISQLERVVAEAMDQGSLKTLIGQ